MVHVIFGPVSIVRMKDKHETVADFLPGGEGMYAWQGASLVSEQVRLVAGVGRDFEDCFGPWAQKNQLGREGIILRTDYCNYCEVGLSDRETSSEKSVYGLSAGRFYYAESILFPQQFLYLLHDAASVILCEKPELVSLQALRSFRTGASMELGWIVPERMRLYGREDFVRRVGILDMYAVNTDTAGAIFGTDQENELIDILRGLGKPFYLMGRDSAWMTIGDFCIAMEWQRQEAAVNFLGCEYTAAAAAMTLFADGKGPYECCRAGRLAYSLQSRQYGLIPDIALRRDFNIEKEAYKK